MDDKYVVYIRKDGTRFYYKNNKLHRESGPAIVISDDKDKYTKLDDDSLYEKTFQPVLVDVREDMYEVVKFPNGKIVTYETTMTFYIFSQYYLDGMKYSEKEFQTIKLKENMEKDLAEKLENSKRIKL